MSTATPILSPQDVIDMGRCLGCGTCAGLTGGEAAMAFDGYGQLKPSGEWRTYRTGTVARTCPFSPFSTDEDTIGAELFPDAQYDPHIGRFRAAYVGWAAADYRNNGSSGGMVSWVAAELLRHGLVDGVAHVKAADPNTEGRFFQYSISRNESELRDGAHSRYYPTEISGVLGEIRRTPGRYAVIAVPCVVKAINLVRRSDPVIGPRIAYTLGLFCGHMKSARFVESFAWQMGVEPKDVAAVEFRKKDASRPANWYRAQLTLRDGSVREQDWWHLADGDWGAGYFMNSACNYCDDVVAETADVSFGDAWVEPYTSDGRGTNVVVVRSHTVAELIQSGIDQHRLELKPVDAAFVVETQAAGFRQRREGLSYRLSRATKQASWPKRVPATDDGITRRRKLIYRTRQAISTWSHRMFSLARRLRTPQIYTRWANTAAALYHALTYSRGRLGQIFDRLGI